MMLTSKTNRYLARFRAANWFDNKIETVQAWLDEIEEDFGYALLNTGLYTPDEIDHARKVLYKLEALTA